MNENNGLSNQAMKVYFGNGWLNYLKDQIAKNRNLSDGLTDKEIESLNQRNDKVLDKLEKYQKQTGKGQDYFYLYPIELRSLFKIMLENNAETRQWDLTKDNSLEKEIEPEIEME